MTRTSETLQALTPLMADLAQNLPARVRYQRLLDALRGLLPCDAIALLQLDGDVLRPLAIHGLHRDALGRRFRVSEHPRLQAILNTGGAMRFPADCDLPDPYDGLVDNVYNHLEVHDCMGCVLHVNEQRWGVLTLDALEAERFSDSDLDILGTFATLAAATVAASERFHALTHSVEKERRRAEAYRQERHQEHRSLTGNSLALEQLRREIALVAGSDLTVLVSGETGTGKELVAHQLHRQSLRADKILVSVNCAALPENLMESELFGHVKGAFSGATQDRAGKFEIAHGGTLFLDEIGELPLNAQAKLLRVLQNGQLQRIGSDQEHRADIRLIAATNRDLAEAVRAGDFRADLYHRLSVFPLRVPTLRERSEDILILAGHFMEENRRKLGLRALRLSAEASHALCQYPWPGNIRELEYVIARAALKARSRQQPGLGIITLIPGDLALWRESMSTDSLSPAVLIDDPVLTKSTPDFRQAVETFKRSCITSALEKHGNNVAATARTLGLDRGNLVRLMTRLGIDQPVHRHRMRGQGR